MQTNPYTRAQPHDSAELRRQGALLGERILRCVGAATFEMETLVRLAGVEASREVASAAVECTGRPRLLLNPDFVAQYCLRDEHLLVLVLHELWHVILGHTRLYPRATRAHNIAFDAVINAGLSRQLTGPQYRGFMEALNPADRFPGLLLRPPEGWPDHPVYPDEWLWRMGTVLRRLYPPPNARELPMPTYEEILELLERNAGCWEALGEDAPGAPFLLGSHGERDEAGERRALEHELFGDIVRKMVAAWPPPPIPIGGRDTGGSPYDWVGLLRPAPDTVRRVFARVLLRALGPHPGRHVRRARAEIPLPAGMGVLPNPADRTLAARRRLGLPLTLHQQMAPVAVRVPERPSSAHVYVDVSGSMFAILPHVAGLLAPYLATGQVRLFQFSTVVEPLALADLKVGRLRTTGGTSLHCVLDHAVATPRLRRALILTDGYVGAARADQVRQLRENRLRLHAVFPAESAYRDDLAGIVESLTILPPFRAAA